MLQNQLLPKGRVSGRKVTVGREKARRKKGYAKWSH